MLGVKRAGIIHEGPAAGTKAVNRVRGGMVWRRRYPSRRGKTMPPRQASKDQVRTLHTRNFPHGLRTTTCATLLHPSSCRPPPSQPSQSAGIVHGERSLSVQSLSISSIGCSCLLTPAPIPSRHFRLDLLISMVPSMVVRSNNCGFRRDLLLSMAPSIVARGSTPVRCCRKPVTSPLLTQSDDPRRHLPSANCRYPMSCSPFP